MTGFDAVTPAGEAAMAEFVRLMDVKDIGADVFIGESPSVKWPRLFGGHVLAQALAATMRTVSDERPPHSVHVSFLRGGDADLPVDYRVERVRDGRSVSSRRVTASQNSREIMFAQVSFHIMEDGRIHQGRAPDLPPPETLMTENEVRKREAAILGADIGHMMMRNQPLELRPVHPVLFSDLKPQSPVADYWVRPVAPVPDDRTIRFCLLAYLSDMTLLLTALKPHALHYAVSEIETGSLDHALWIHDAPLFDDWVIWSTRSPWTGHARAFMQGAVYDRSGKVCAHVAQEGLMRSF